MIKITQSEEQKEKQILKNENSLKDLWDDIKCTNILKGVREKQKVTYKGFSRRLLAHFSAETLQVRREWHNTLRVLKGKNLQPRMFCPERLSFRIKGDIKQLLRQAETHQHYTYPKRNVKGSSPCGQEESTGKGKAHLERQIESKSRHVNAMTRFFLEAGQRLQALFLSYHSDVT